MSRFLGFVLLAATSTFVGCGGGGDAAERTPVFPVSGTVTMFGSPLANATVAFAPQGDQPTAVGTTDGKGNFQLTTYEYGDGAAEGNYKVVISKSAVAAAGAGSSAQAGEHEVEVEDTHVAAENDTTTVELVPQQYTSAADTPLTAEVKSSGDNVFPFKIE